MNHPYRWDLWDGSPHKVDLQISRGYVQQPVQISCFPESLKPISTEHATIILKAEGGLDKNYAHENNISLAPYVFSWSTNPTPPEWNKHTIYMGHSFNNIEWFVAGGQIENEMQFKLPVFDVNSSQITVYINHVVYYPSSFLDVNQAIDNMGGGVDIDSDGTGDTSREEAEKAYWATKRLELGKTYYFFAARLGGVALFSTSGFRPGNLTKSGQPTDMVNFISSKVSVSPPITMSAKATTFTVSFNSNGGTLCTPRLIAYGQKVPEPLDPEKKGCTFAGWFLTRDFKTQFRFNTPITRDLVLYGKWINTDIEKYIVRFNTIGGSVVAPQLVAKGQYARKPGNPTKNGCVFDKWYSNAACTTAFDFSMPITKSITIYGWWKEVSK